MENKKIQQCLYFIFESKIPVYLKKSSILDAFVDLPRFEINGNNQMSFVETLQKFINDNHNSKEMFVIINTDNISADYQNRLSFLVKEKIYQTIFLPDNCKVIVTGNKEKISKEILGHLVEVDV